jgi:hypothetical protein
VAVVQSFEQLPPGPSKTLDTSGSERGDGRDRNNQAVSKEADFTALAAKRKS